MLSKPSMLRGHRLPLIMLTLGLWSSQTTAQTYRTVTGTVRYGDTGKAAEGVRVWLSQDRHDSTVHPDPTTGEYTVSDGDQPSAPPTAQVGSDGKFVIRGVRSGTYIVHTYSPAYVSPDDTVFLTSNTEHIATGPRSGDRALRVTVSAGAPDSRVDVVLHRGGVIEGSVPVPITSSSAKELSLPFGVAINAERKLAANSYARAAGAAHADASGHYRLEGLAPGDYIVFMAGPAMMVHASDGSTLGGSGLPVYAPETVRPSEAVLVHITGSETHRLDFTPSHRTLHSVQGVVSVDGAVLPRMTLVRMYPTGEGGLTAAVPLGAGNSFSFVGVPDGDYTVSVEFQPTQEVVSADLKSGTVRMRMRPPLYTTASQDVRIAGSDVSGLVLRPVRTAAASTP